MKTITLFSILLFSAPGAVAQSITELWAGNGTGIVIDSKGLIATNYHVVKDALEIEVDFGKGDSKRSYKCEVLLTDKKNDLAILRIIDRRFSGFGALPYTFKTSTAKTGESVFALGYPKALSILGTEIKYTRGDISALSGAEGDLTTYTLSLSIQPGNSGGPLFDFYGNLLGITNAKIVSPDVDNVSYAIKSLYLKNLIDLSSYRITLPTGASLTGMPITEQIEILSDYVGLIKIRLPNTETEARTTSSPPNSTGEMVGACGVSIGKIFADKWLQTGGGSGILGCPYSSEVEAEKSSQGTTGRYVEFRGNGINGPGSIYWHRTGRYSGQVFIVRGGILQLYKGLGRGSSWLGFPISDEYDATGGRRSDFEGGYIYWDKWTGLSRAFKYN